MNTTVTDLNTPILYFKEKGVDNWTLREATQGVQIFGSIGSGKSSGSGQFLARVFLRKGFGGIVLTGKVGEREEWEEYARLEGRKDDLVIFSEKHPYKFNPLQYEMVREGEGAKKSENIVQLFMSLVRLGDRIGGTSSDGGSDPFWDLALKRCIKSAVDLLIISDTEVTIENMVKVIRECPEPFEQEGTNKDLFWLLVNNEDHEELEKWANESLTVECLYKAISKALDEEESRLFEMGLSYFLKDLAEMPEKTKMSILEMVYAYADPFMSGMLYTYFSTDISREVMPEKTFDGKIIILDFPVKEYLHLGIYAQMIYKKVWQQAVERRKVTSKSGRPVFMWVDEAQYFVNEDDMLFQTTARSSKACTVLITQNISNYYAAIGGKNPVQRVNSLLGNLVTKIFHANNDYVTNEWAANTIGKSPITRENISTAGGGAVSTSTSVEYQVHPNEFTTLRTGGEANGLKVDAYIVSVGRKWSSGKNYLKTLFNQK